MKHTTSETLNAAADHIRKYGLHCGSVHADLSRVGQSASCTIGAIHVAARRVTGLPFSWDAADAAKDALRDYLMVDPDRFVSIADWSDARTAAEVIEVLRAAAVIEAARERSTSDAHTADVALEDGYVEAAGR